jgi:hypothetical protein
MLDLRQTGTERSLRLRQEYKWWCRGRGWTERRWTAGNLQQPEVLPNWENARVPGLAIWGSPNSYSAPVKPVSLR